MARTTSAAVQAVMLPGKDYDTTNAPSLTPFIDAASAVVDRVNECATERGFTLSATELELIERWLAAHYYVGSDQTYASKSTRDASASFQGKTDKGIEGSQYGQRAMMLDPSGCLASLGQNKRALGFWLGKAPSEQTDYVDRD